MIAFSTSHIIVCVALISTVYSQGVSLSTEAECATQGLKNCSSCASPGLLCYQCPARYRLKADNSGCEQCPTNCETCQEGSSGSVCTKCVTKYQVGSSGECVACPDNCNSCRTSGTKVVCEECVKDAGKVYTLNMDATECLGCPENCKECVINSAGTSTGCTGCNTGYVARFPDGNCIPCPNNCATCTESGGLTTCSLCTDPGYILNSVESSDQVKACLVCPSTCGVCSGTEEKTSTGVGTGKSTCSTCGDGVLYNANTGNCDSCTTQCKKCTSTASTDCTECNAEYYVSSGQCAACPHKCSTCTSVPLVNGQPTCTACVQGYGQKKPYPETCDACPANCATCTIDGVCSKCKELYGLNAAKECVSCSTNCLSCSLSGSTWTCNSCKQLYKPSGATCYQCPAGCSDAKCEYDALLSTPGAKCTVCDLDTTQTVDDSAGTCLDCPTNCAECTYNSTVTDFTCTACDPYYGLDNIGACVSCSAGCPNCTYNSGVMRCVCIDRPAAGTHTPANPVSGTPTSYFGTCTSGGFTANACDDGYWYDKDNFVCKTCDVTNCHVCAGMSSQCAQCADGYTFPASGGTTCELCTELNCATCTIVSSAQQCTKCNDRFGLTTTYQCLDCKDTRCQQCSYTGSGNTQKCDSCETGYVPNGEETCVKCPDNCDACSYSSTGTTSCTTCKGRYAKDVGKCYGCPANCAVCTYENSKTKCTQCDPKFALSNSGTCSGCPANCATCASPKECTTCDALYGLAKDKSCQACTSDCAACEYSTANKAMQCTQCDANYVINAEQCGGCPEFCVSCISSDTGMVCTSCVQGYYAHPTTKQCTMCDQQCTNCTGAGCKGCSSGYGLNADKTGCTACSALTGIAECSECSSTKCTACQSGYAISADNKCTSGASGVCAAWEDKGWQCTKCTVDGQVATTDGTCGYQCHSCSATVDYWTCLGKSCECNKTSAAGYNVTDCTMGTCLVTSTRNLVTNSTVITRECGTADTCSMAHTCTDTTSSRGCTACCQGSLCNSLTHNHGTSIRGTMIEQTLWMILFAVQLSLW